MERRGGTLRTPKAQLPEDSLNKAVQDESVDSGRNDSWQKADNECRGPDQVRQPLHSGVIEMASRIR